MAVATHRKSSLKTRYLCGAKMRLSPSGKAPGFHPGIFLASSNLVSRSNIEYSMWPCGEIVKHSGFKIRRLNASQLESEQGYQSANVA